MIVARLEVHPQGDSTKSYEIGRVEIANVEGLVSRAATYQYRFSRGGGFSPWFRLPGRHTRGAGAWVLLLKILEHAAEGAPATLNNQEAVRDRNSDRAFRRGNQGAPDSQAG